MPSGWKRSPHRWKRSSRSSRSAWDALHAAGCVAGRSPARDGRAKASVSSATRTRRTCGWECFPEEARSWIRRRGAAARGRPRRGRSPARRSFPHRGESRGADLPPAAFHDRGFHRARTGQAARSRGGPAPCPRGSARTGGAVAGVGPLLELCAARGASRGDRAGARGIGRTDAEAKDTEDVAKARAILAKG